MRGHRRDERGAESLLAREVFAHPAAFSTVMPLRLRRAPVLLLAACFATGILCRGWWVPAASMVLCCALLLMVAAVAIWCAPRLTWVAACIAWIALGWAAEILTYPVADTSLLRYADELQRTVDAHVAAVRPVAVRPVQAEDSDLSKEAPREEETAFTARAHSHETRYVMDLAVNAVEDITPETSRMVPISGGVHVTVFSRQGITAQAPPCGSHVLLTLRMHPPQRYLDPGVWQYADALAQRGVSVESAADAGTLRVMSDPTQSWACRLAEAQRRSADQLHRLVESFWIMRLPPLMRLTQDDAAILSAMLVGDRTQLTKELRSSFEKTGSFHLFVVAGVHVTLLLAMLYGALIKVRAPRWLATVFSLSLTFVYALLTGFGAPVQRALFMAAVYMLTQLLSRDRSPMNALGVAVLAMLVARPAALFESSLQMTVLAVVAITGIAWPLCERTMVPYMRACKDIASTRMDLYHVPRIAQFRVSMRWLGETLAQIQGKPQAAHWGKRVLLSLPAWCMRLMLAAVELTVITLVAEMVMALPMAAYFHRVTLFAAPTNLLVLPLIAAVMVCAIVTFAASLLSPVLAALPAAITALLLHGVTSVVGRMSSLRGADVRTPSPLFIAVIIACVFWWVAVVLLRLPAPRWGRAALVCLLLAFAAVMWRRQPQLVPGSLEFTAIDVGQGDSLLVGLPNGETMLIDAGGPTGSATLTEQSSFDIGEEVVSPFLWTRGLRRIDVAVLTHAHSDHIGGMAAILRNFSPRELWVSVDADTPSFRQLMQLAQNRGITVRHLFAGDAFPLGETAMRVLSPTREYKPQPLPTNNDSLVLEMTYGSATVLAEGDAEHPSEHVVMRGDPGHVTLLKVGHHGSATSTGDEFLNVVQPRVAVISCGLGNRFGHPRMPVLQRLQAAGVRTARTDRMGAVQYLLRRDGSIETHVLPSQP